MRELAPFSAFLQAVAEAGEAPLFSGGILDSWPAWAVDVVAIRRQEVAAIQAYEQHLREQEARRG